MQNYEADEVFLKLYVDRGRFCPQKQNKYTCSQRKTGGGGGKRVWVWVTKLKNYLNTSTLQSTDYLSMTPTALPIPSSRTISSADAAITLSATSANAELCMSRSSTVET